MRRSYTNYFTSNNSLNFHTQWRKCHSNLNMWQQKTNSKGIFTIHIIASASNWPPKAHFLINSLLMNKILTNQNLMIFIYLLAIHNKKKLTVLINISGFCSVNLFLLLRRPINRFWRHLIFIATKYMSLIFKLHGERKKLKWAKKDLYNL